MVFIKFLKFLEYLYGKLLSIGHSRLDDISANVIREFTIKIAKENEGTESVCN